MLTSEQRYALVNGTAEQAAPVLIDAFLGMAGLCDTIAQLAETSPASKALFEATRDYARAAYIGLQGKLTRGEFQE